MKKFIALFLVFSIISLYTGLYAKERRGVDIMIQKKDWQQVAGELIAVKQNSLLLKESVTGVDVTAVVCDMNLETPREELTTGSTFAGRYQIIEELGKGGMGKVYKAIDKKVNEKIALKLINPYLYG